MTKKGGLGRGLGGGLNGALDEMLKESSKKLSEIADHEVKSKTAEKIQKKERAAKPSKLKDILKRGFEALFGKGKKEAGRPKKSLGLGHGANALFDSRKSLLRKDNRNRKKQEPRTVSKELPAAPRVPYASSGDNRSGFHYKDKPKGVGMSQEFGNESLEQSLKLAAKFFYRIVSRTPVDEDYKYTESREIDPAKKKSFVLGKARNMQYKVMPKTKSGVYERWHKKDTVVAREEWTLTVNGTGFTMKDFDGIDFEHVGSESWMEVYDVLKSRIGNEAPGGKADRLDVLIRNDNPYIDVLEYGLYKKKDAANDAEAHEGKKYYHGTNAGYSVQAPRGMIRLTDAEFDTLSAETKKGEGLNPDRLETIGPRGTGAIEWAPPINAMGERDEMNGTFWRGLREAMDSGHLFDERDILKSMLDNKPSVEANAASLRKIRYKAEQEMFKKLRSVEKDRQKVREYMRQLKKALRDKKKEIEAAIKEENKRLREERKKAREEEKARKAMSAVVKVQTPKTTTSKEIFREALKIVKAAPESFEKASTDPTAIIAFGNEKYEITVNDLGDYGVKLDGEWVDFLELYKVYNKSPKAKSMDFDDWIDDLDLDWQY